MLWIAWLEWQSLDFERRHYLPQCPARTNSKAGRRHGRPGEPPWEIEIVAPGASGSKQAAGRHRQGSRSWPSPHPNLTYCMMATTYIYVYLIGFPRIWMAIRSAAAACKDWLLNHLPCLTRRFCIEYHLVRSKKEKRKETENLILCM